MSDDRLLPGRSYLMKITHDTARCDGHRAQAPARCRHAVEACRQDAGAERGRRLQSVAVARRSLRRLCRQPRDRRLHPDRSLFKRDGRRRHDRFCVSPRHQYSPAESDRKQARAFAAHAPSPSGAVVHRASRRGKSTIANLVEAGLHAPSFCRFGSSRPPTASADVCERRGSRIAEIGRVGQLAGADGVQHDDAGSGHGATW